MPPSALLRPKEKHIYRPGTPHVSLVFMYAVNPRRRLRASNDSFADTGRSNATDTPRFLHD